MFKYINILLILSFITQISVADDSVFLEKNAPAPFQGFLLSADKIKELRNNDIELQFQIKRNSNLELELTDYNQRLNIYKDQNEQLVKKTSSESGLYTVIGGFILGSLITGVIAFGVTKSLK